MKIYVITCYNDDYERDDIVGVTRDGKLAERYCAIHDGCEYLACEEGVGLELTEEELAKPLNTFFSGNWNYLTEKFEDLHRYVTAHAPKPWSASPNVGTHSCALWFSGIVEGERDLSTPEKMQAFAEIELSDLVEDRKPAIVSAHNNARKRVAKSIITPPAIGGYYNRPPRKHLLDDQHWAPGHIERAIDRGNRDQELTELEFAKEIADITEEETGVRYEMTGEVKKNFDFMKQNMKAYGYFYSGPRMDHDDVRLVFQKYGTEGVDKDLIAYSYERLKDVTKANIFQEWFARSLRELFKETEEG